MTDCKQCGNFTTNKSFCSIKCYGKYKKNTQYGKDNPSYKNGNDIRVDSLCSFCERSTTKLLKSKESFCNIKCKANWQKNNLVKEKNPNFGKRHPGLNLGRKHSEDTKKLLSELTIKQISHPSFWKDTSIEKIVENWLLFNEIFDYVKQFRYKLGVADFYLPEENLIIECDGDYWHSLPKNMERDKIQTKYLEDNGYIVIRLCETDIVENIDGCLKWIV